MNEEINCDYFRSLLEIEEVIFPYKEETGSYALVKEGCLEVYHPPEGPTLWSFLVLE